MIRKKYSLQQVSVGLLYSALTLEDYMNETFNIFKDENGIYPFRTNSFYQLRNWSLEESFELGLGAHEIETWGDELFGSFIPIVDKLFKRKQSLQGKLAFTVLAISYVLEVYLNLPNALDAEKANSLLSEFKEYLRKKWNTNLDNGVLSLELSDFHVPMAQEFAKKWQKQLESLTT